MFSDVWHPHEPHVPQVEREGTRVRVRTPYWTVEHDESRGGCPVSIRFTHGSGENLLAQPLHAHVGQLSQWVGGTFRMYRQCHARDGRVEVETGAEAVRLHLSGHVADEEGCALPVAYRQTYAYMGWGRIDVSLTFVLEERVERIFEFGVCNAFLHPAVDFLGVRQATAPGLYPTSARCEWHEVRHTGSWRDARKPTHNTIPLYVGAFRKGVEGIEFFRGDDAEPWNRFAGVEPGQGIHSFERSPRNEHLFIRNEVFCDWANPTAFEQGEYPIDFHLALPFVKPRRSVKAEYLHVSLDSRCWPTREELAAYAARGVRLLRLHDDNTHKPTFWADGTYPPYEPEDMAEMDRVIRDAHDLGMKILPYFSLKEFNKRCPEFAEGAPQWYCKMWSSDRIHGEDGCFGAYMCQKSGWVEFLKFSIDRVLSKHDFDGVYFDHLWPRECRHPDHCGGHDHVDTAEVLEFLAWTRRRVGPGGMVWTHLSGCPNAVAENLSDLTFFAEGFELCAPDPGGYPPEVEYVPVAPRHWVEGRVLRDPDPALHRMQHIYCLQEGWPSNLYSTRPLDEPHQWLMREWERIAPYLDPRYALIPARERPVDGGEGVTAAVFLAEGESVIYAANASAETRRVRLTPTWLRFPDDPEARFRVTVEGGETGGERSARDLAERGIPVTIEGYGSLLVTLASVGGETRSA